MSASGVRSRAAATMARNSSVSVGLSVAGQFGPWGVISTAESPTIRATSTRRSEEHTSELQSPCNLVCRLILEKKHTSELQSPCNLVCRLLLEKKKKYEERTTC